VTESAFVIATASSYGLALTGYVIFVVWVALVSRASPRARLLLLALVATALWTASCLAVVALSAPGTLVVAGFADALRYGAWYLFLWHVLARSDVPVSQKTFPWPAFGVVTAVLIWSVLLGGGLKLGGFTQPAGMGTGYLLHLALAVFGLMLVEQLLRRVRAQMRWGIKPLAIALAAVFGFDLLFYADALLFGVVDPDFWVARAVANVIVIPLIALATARSTGWTVDLHVSRRVVFQSSALLVSGAFLLAVAGAGYFVRYFGGDWGRALQIELLFAAAVVVVLVPSSGGFDRG
jgi:hypothetical protein